MLFFWKEKEERKGRGGEVGQEVKGGEERKGVQGWEEERRELVLLSVYIIWNENISMDQSKIDSYLKLSDWVMNERGRDV